MLPAPLQQPRPLETQSTLRSASGHVFRTFDRQLFQRSGHSGTALHASKAASSCCASHAVPTCIMPSDMVTFKPSETVAELQKRLSPYLPPGCTLDTPKYEKWVQRRHAAHDEEVKLLMKS